MTPKFRVKTNGVIIHNINDDCVAITETQWQDAKRLARLGYPQKEGDGKLVQAIKLLRRLSGLGLRDAKWAMDAAFYLVNCDDDECEY